MDKVELIGLAGVVVFDGGEEIGIAFGGAATKAGTTIGRPKWCCGARLAGAPVSAGTRARLGASGSSVSLMVFM